MTMTNSAKGCANTRAPELSNVEDLINSVDTFIFDCDGVIWKGETLIDGVPETLDMLRSRGKSLVFMTNNSTKSRKQYRKKFEALGLTVQEEEIFPSSFAAAAYLKSIDFPHEKKVYVIGGEGILQELELCGIKGIGGPEDGDKNIQFAPGFFMEHDKDVGAVVVGFDQFINYYKIQYGTLCIRENPGCLFIATNCDAVGHFTDAQEWADLLKTFQYAGAPISIPSFCEIAAYYWVLLPPFAVRTGQKGTWDLGAESTLFKAAFFLDG